MYSKLTKSRPKPQAVSCVKGAVREEYMSKLRLMFTAAAICGGLTATAVSAMPIAPAPADTAAKLEQVRWVCGPYGRCWWRPNYYYGGYYGYGYYPRRFYYRPYYRPYYGRGYRWGGPYW